MAWGRSNERWNHTASLMWLLASIHADPNSGRKPQLGHYHPYLPQPQLPELPPGMLAGILKSAAPPKPEATRE